MLIVLGWVHCEYIVLPLSPIKLNFAHDSFTFFSSRTSIKPIIKLQSNTQTPRIYTIPNIQQTSENSPKEAQSENKIPSGPISLTKSAREFNNNLENITPGNDTAPRRTPEEAPGLHNYNINHQSINQSNDSYKHTHINTQTDQYNCILMNNQNC